MHKPLIAVDMDDVLAHENEAVRLYSNKVLGLNHKPEDYLTEGPYWSYWHDKWGLDKEAADKHFEGYLASGAKSELLAHEDALDVLTGLKKRFDLVIVTSRTENVTDLTHAWLERNFPNLFRGIEFVYRWQDNFQGSKGDICKALGASYLIDDNLQHCTGAAIHGIKSLLYGNYGWNKTKDLPNGVVRVKDWQAVKEYFDGR